MANEIISKDLMSESTEYRKRRSIKEIVRAALDAPLAPERVEKYKEAGVELEDHEFTVLFEMIMGQAQSAAAKGNTNAFRELVELLKEDEKANLVKDFYLPAKLLSKSFIDINRKIDDREYKEFVFKGGRFSTKSSYIALKMIELIINTPNTHALAVRPYENTLRDSVFAQLRWAISVLDLDDDFKATTSPMQIVYKPTGQTIYLRGADDPAKIKSIKPPFGYIAFLWFEELDQFRGEEQVRNVQQSSMRGGEISLVFKSFNPPRSRAAWANKYVRQPKPNMHVHHSTYKDVPEEWIGPFGIEEAQILKDLNEAAYIHEYLGEAVGDGANVFDNLTLREISDSEIAAFDRLYFGQDWGWFPDPNAFVGMHYDANRKQLYIFKEFTGNRIKNEEWADIIKDYKNEIITADSAEPKSVSDFRSYGFDMRGAEKGPGSVVYSMKWLGSLVEIIIDPIRCPIAAKEFMDYEHERDKDGNVVTGYPDLNNHTIDAVRYALERVWRRKGQ